MEKKDTVHTNQPQRQIEKVERKRRKPKRVVGKKNRENRIKIYQFVSPKIIKSKIF